MSYVGVPRGNYETYVPDGPWQSGAPGWATTPMPGWGNNENQALPHRQGTAGCGCAAAGIGDDVLAKPLPVWPVFVLGGATLAGMWIVYKLAMHSERRLSR